MNEAQLHSKFLALWRKALGLSSLNDLTPELVQGWAQQIRLNAKQVTVNDVGIFQTFKAIVVEAEGGTACLPMISHMNDSTWLANRARSNKVAALWAKVEWFAPLWVSMGKTSKLLKDIEHRPKKESLELFDYHTSTIYTLAFEAVCIVQLMSSSRTLAEFVPLAREAYLAFYSGHRASSIAALIPVMEGAFRRISATNTDKKLLDQIDEVIERACGRAAKLHFSGMWAPREYMTTEFLFGQDERVFVFETYRRWLKESFFRSTGDYDGLTWLNRHLFAHGVSTQWHNSANFSRLVVALATLGVIESWHDESNKVSLFLPEMTDDSRLLHRQAILHGQTQMLLKLTEQASYQKHGRLVPPMPTDDGITLRAALLMDDCIKDLVRPLRTAGWSVEVGENDAEALYVKVVATRGDTKLRAALLYSCGTDNKLYQELAESNDVILYRGPPYHQDQYAYGIKVHVGPVTGWQPPIAPGARVARPCHPLRAISELLFRTRSR